MPKPKPKSEAPRPEGQVALNSQTTEIVVPEAASANIKHDALDRFRQAILERHTLAVTAMVDALLRRIECGALLHEARKLIPHRSWEKWLADNFSADTGLSIRSAQRYLRDYLQFRHHIEQHPLQEPEATDLSPQAANDRLIRYCRETDRRSSKQRPNTDEANSWHSPKAVIDAVEAVLGSIDCDPSASSNPHAVMVATTNYTATQNGLAADCPWTGTAWIAPGHHGDLTPWTEKTVAEFEAGRLTDAILCLPVTPLNLPPRLQSCPVAISRSPLMVGYLDGADIRLQRLKMPSLFVYLSQAANTETFAWAFRDIAVVLGFVAGRSHGLTVSSTRSVKS